MNEHEKGTLAAPLGSSCTRGCRSSYWLSFWQPSPWGEMRRPPGP